MQSIIIRKLREAKNDYVNHILNQKLCDQLLNRDEQKALVNEEIERIENEFSAIERKYESFLAKDDLKSLAKVLDQAQELTKVLKKDIES